jgi:hypothetical protein
MKETKKNEIIFRTKSNESLRYKVKDQRSEMRLPISVAELTTRDQKGSEDIRKKLQIKNI